MREGYKDTPIGMIPVEWEVVKLGDVAKLIMSNVDKKNHSNEKEVLLCNYLDVYENEYITDGLKFMSATASDAEIERFLLKMGDVIVTKDSETKEDIAHSSAVIQDFESTLCGYHLALIRPINKNFDNIFLSKLFSIDSVHKELVNKANGTTRYGLTVGTFKNLLLPYPPLPEQSRIATILSTIDDKIDAINKRITQTQQLKIGLMQRLLTKGVGHTKFKDSPLGEIPESWHVKKIGEITKVCVGKDLLGQNYSPNWSDEYKHPVYSNTVENKGLYGYYNIPEYTGNSVTVIGRGVGVGTAFPRKDSFGAIGRLIVLFPISGLNEVYLSYNINFCVKFFVESSAIPQLTGAQISKYFITFPPFQEQQKIAEILSSVDEKLDVLQEKKTEYNQLKTGLMQQLLTGKIRVMV